MRYYSIVLLFFLVSCIESIIFDTNGEEGPIAINGLVTNTAGTSIVTVGRSVPYDNQSFNSLAVLPIRGAIVTVLDDQGGEFNFLDGVEMGEYSAEDEAFKGSIGLKYKVRVQLDDGKNYESEWDEMVSVPEIKTLDIKPFERNVLSNGINVVRTGVEVFSITADPIEQRNFYRWRSLGLYEIQFPFDQRGPCWVRERDIDRLLIFEDSELNGKTLETSIAQIGLGGRQNIQNKYVFSVEQQSLSKGAFEYLDQVKQQREAQGTLFDPTPASIIGNINSVDDDNEAVVGYFGASAVSIFRITIDTVLANAEPYNDCEGYFRTPGFCFNCSLIPNTTRTKPDWF